MHTDYTQYVYEIQELKQQLLSITSIIRSNLEGNFNKIIILIFIFSYIYNFVHCAIFLKCYL